MPRQLKLSKAQRQMFRDMQQRILAEAVDSERVKLRHLVKDGSTRLRYSSDPKELTTALDRQVGGNHYKDDAIQHVEFCQRNKLTWCESAALKYMMRHRKKNGVQDIDKAIHYLEILKQLEYPESIPAVIPAKI